MEKEEIIIREKVSKLFPKMTTKEDLVDLLNLVRRYLYPNIGSLITIKTLNYYSYYRTQENKYRLFEIPKKNGEKRKIYAPFPKLKMIQRCLNFIFTSIFIPHHSSTGFIPNKSIKDAAFPHVGMPYIFHIDLKDFFPSIEMRRFKACLGLKPFGLNGEKESLSFLIANLCCMVLEDRAFLPQGAPTSPVISNIVCLKLDRLLTRLARKYNVRYTRYADDLTFSSFKNIFDEEGVFKTEVVEVINNQGFKINDKKTRLDTNGYRQRVCGLIVNKKVNVSKRYIKELRMYLYYWEKYGYGKAFELYNADLNKKNIYIENTYHKDLDKVLEGKLLFLKMIRGANDLMYTKLYNRFSSLIIKDNFPNLDYLEIDVKKLLSDINIYYSIGSSSSQEQQKLFVRYNNLKSELNSRFLKGTSIEKELKSCGELLLNIYSVGLVEKSNIINRFHTPLLVVNFLYNNFSVESPLKYLTHSWDGIDDKRIFQNYDDFMRLVNSRFSSISDDFKTLSPMLFRKFYSFVKGKFDYNPKQNINSRGWGMYRIRFGWSAIPLANWSIENPSKNPYDFKLPQQYQTQIGRNRVIYFKDVIELFKGEFQFRAETHQMHDLFRRLVLEYLQYDFKVSLEIKDVKLYSDVETFMRVIERIFRSIALRLEYPNINIYLENNCMDSIDVVIEQVNSFSNVSSVEMSNAVLSGDFREIHNQLINVCDWYLETRCTDGFYRFCYLTSQRDMAEKYPIDSAIGFKYIFRFYKPTFSL